jgi:hypothetical protein
MNYFLHAGILKRCLYIFELFAFTTIYMIIPSIIDQFTYLKMANYFNICRCTLPENLGEGFIDNNL